LSVLLAMSEAKLFIFQMKSCSIRHAHDIVEIGTAAEWMSHWHHHYHHHRRHHHRHHHQALLCVTRPPPAALPQPSEHDDRRRLLLGASSSAPATQGTDEDFA
jgi:hypothetical protein